MSDNPNRMTDELRQLAGDYRSQQAPAGLTRRIVLAAEDRRAPRNYRLPAFAGVAAAVVAGLFLMLNQSAVGPRPLSMSALSAEVARANREVARAVSRSKTRSPSLSRLPSVRLSPASPTLRPPPPKETNIQQIPNRTA